MYPIDYRIAMHHRLFCPDQELFGCTLSGNIRPSGHLGNTGQNLPQHHHSGKGHQRPCIRGGAGEQNGATL